MNKLSSIVICAVLLAAPAFAQDSREAVLKQITKDTCQELSGVDLSNKSPDEFKMSLGLVLLSVAGNYRSQLNSNGIDISDQLKLQDLAQNIGMRLAIDCPAFVSALTKNTSAVQAIVADTKKNTPAAPTGSVSGKLVKIVDGDFTYLQVEDSKGKVEKLWWLEYFEGSNRFVTDPKSQLNKQIKVNYVEKEIFNSTLKEYVKIKIVTAVE
jgi:hypothetical protein